MDFKAQWNQLTERFEAKSRRDRFLLIAVAAAGVPVLGSLMLVQPHLVRAKSLNGSILQQQREIDTLRVQLANVQDQLKQDPDAIKKAEVEALKDKVRGIEEKLVKAEGAFVPPERMSMVLDTLLQRHPGLRLLGVRTLEPIGLLGQAEKSEPTRASSEFNLYRHGVEIRLEGSYGDLRAYLSQLEQGPQKLLWGDASLMVVEYPKAVLTLVVYTLNSDKTWLIL